jgi:hypothetical protein
VTAIAAGFGAIGNLAAVAAMSNVLIMLVFLMVNAALLKIRTESDEEAEFRIPLSVGRYPITATVDPQEHFGIAPGKPLTVPVWAQSKDQSRDVFWRDLVAVIKEAPCFKQYIAEERADKLSLWSPRQLAQPLASRGAPAIEIVARESTESAARGYASPVQVHDKILSMQFPSWELYEDWESWESIPLYPGGPTSAPIQRSHVPAREP